MPVLKMQKSTVWKTPETIPIILTSLLDPAVIPRNSTIYKMIKDGNMVSFLSIKNFKDATELGTVYTKKRHRRKGCATHLIQKILPKLEEPVYLLCQKPLEGFYERFDFKETEEVPASIRKRLKLANILNTVLFRDKTIAMKRQ